MAILSRGFAVVRRSGATEAIRDASSLEPGNTVSITFASGGAVADIVEVNA